MDKIKLSLDITNPSEFHNLGIELWIDKAKFFDNLIGPGTHHVINEFESNEADHEFKIILKNKTDEHTSIDEAGNIVEDVLINVKNISLDEINIDRLVVSHSEYHHSGNDSYKQQPHKFYGNLGCNGTVMLKFSTPVYIWLLENM
jgi:hypothetical protein